MVTKNRDLFQQDPTTFIIPNDGTAKVYTPHTPGDWDVLRFELSSFVCEGEYRKGLERVLTTFLANLNNPGQPAVWVSGFYGSGKSHFVRVFEYLWRDVEFPDGARARSLARLPTEITDLLKELTVAGKRAGGLWSAAGTLGAAPAGSVRLALLAIAFRSTGLPEQYPLARFVIWLRQNGYYEAVKARVEQEGKGFVSEIENLYVSPLIADSLLEVYPEFASSPAEARSLFRVQYPPEEDISDSKFLATLEDVLELQSDTPGKLPLTLLVFDELQQFIGEDPVRTLLVQNVVEICSSRFSGRLLLVATGQAALQATPQLSKLQGRFTVRVMLSDTDVEQVVRAVVLRKDPTKVVELKAVLENARGEIDRHLAGTKIGPTSADSSTIVADYPLLPTRRRFWERVLRAIDPAGTAGQLRTQLRIVYEANRLVADRPVGVIVPADMIYEQQKSSMQQTGTLLREVATTIEQQRDGTATGELRARLCALVFLIGSLPTKGVLATGLQATADTLADLLVENLNESSTPLRQQVPVLLQDLVNAGTLMAVGDEFRLQTRASAEWETDFRSRYARIRADDSRIASDRAAEFRQAVSTLLKNNSLPQGVSKTPRKFELYYGLDMPKAESTSVPVWVRDEWSVSEKAMREEAQAAGTESPIVFVLLPRRDSDALRDDLAGYAAAIECLDSRPVSTTPEDMDARASMQSRRDLERQKLDGLIAGIVNQARVFQGGGNEVVEHTLAAAVRVAVEASLVRLFPRFGLADHPDWGKVVKRAQEGSQDALTVVGYVSDVEMHPVCQEIRIYVGGAGKRGGDIRKRFTGVGYGWPQDAVDGALLVLVAGGFVRAAQNGQPRTARQIVQSQIGITDFYSEGVTVTVPQRIAIRKLLADLDVPCQPNEESVGVLRALQYMFDLADKAGGPPPLPEKPSTAQIEYLRALSGNEQLAAVYEAREDLLKRFQAWSSAQEKSAHRWLRWRVLQRLLTHAQSLPVGDQVRPAAVAIQADRALLTEPDPVSPLIGQLSDALRAALHQLGQRLNETYQREMAALTASTEWQQIEDGARQLILARNGLQALPEVRLGSVEDLLDTLDRMPLSGWDNMLAALPARFEQARLQATQLLEPQAVRVHPHPATLRTPEEVDDYLADLRGEIMEHIAAGNPVIL